MPSYGTIPELPHVAKVPEQMLWNCNLKQSNRGECSFESTLRAYARYRNAQNTFATISARSRPPSFFSKDEAPPHQRDELSRRGGFGRAGVSTIGRVDNSLRQSDRLMMAIALTVRLGSFDTLPMAGTRRGDS